jgi:hypothetical protein
MDEENSEWPEPSVPLYLYPRVAVPALVTGGVMQYIWAQYVLPLFSFYTLVDSEFSEMGNSIVNFMTLVFATVTSRPEPNALEILFGAVFAASTMFLLMATLLLPICLVGAVLAYPLNPGDSEIPRI